MNRLKRHTIIAIMAAMPLLVWHSCIIDTEGMNALSDIDGNKYVIKTIGTQKWITSNLKTTKFTDGTIIPMVSNKSKWMIPKEPAMCWYDNNEDNKHIYGGLYNFYVIDTAFNGGKHLCPTGWHVPTLDDWDLLIEFLGGYSYAGDALKDMERGSWMDPYFSINNAANFSALPAGYRTGNGDFKELVNWAVWWSSTENTTTAASGVMIAQMNSSITINEKVSKNIGTSIRCVKD